MTTNEMRNALGVDDDNLAELRDLCAKGTAQRVALDETLATIEAIVGVDLDGLDEWVGNGVDAEDVIRAAYQERLDEDAFFDEEEK